MATMPKTTQKPVSFQVMTKPRGAICNLNCEYCYFLAKELLYPDSRFRMAHDLCRPTVPPWTTTGATFSTRTSV